MSDENETNNGDYASSVQIQQNAAVGTVNKDVVAPSCGRGSWTGPNSKSAVALVSKSPKRRIRLVRPTRRRQSPAGAFVVSLSGSIS